MSLQARRPFIVYGTVTIAAIFFGGVIALSRTGTADSAKDVAVTGGGPTFIGPRQAATQEADRRAGFSVRYLVDERFELLAIGLQDDVNGVRESVRRAEHVYGNRAIDRERALPVVMIIEWTGRQEPLSGGRMNEPDPVPVNSAVPGLELLRVDVEGAEAFTAYFGGTTSHIVFYDPAPPDVLEIIEAHFRN